MRAPLIWAELQAEAEWAGAGTALQLMLGCAWGRRVHTPDDSTPCGRQATRIMVIHMPPGTTPEAMEFRFCADHFARAELETTRRPAPLRCPTACDTDCELNATNGCHEGHAIPSRREHHPRECPSQTGEPLPSDHVPFGPEPA